MAREFTTDRGVHYIRGSIEEWSAPEESVDLVVSSLALHYVADLRTVADRIANALVPGGSLALSVEHLVCTAHPVGWQSLNGVARALWPLDHCAEEGIRHTEWFVNGVIKSHRSISTYLNTLIGVGLNITAVDEPIPAAEAIARRPVLEDELRRPPTRES